MNLAIVTGTSRGLGRAIAGALLRRSWTVVGIARGDAPEELSDDQYTHGRIDLRDLSSVKQWLESHVSGQLRSGSCERVALVNNAALLEPIVPTTKIEPGPLVDALLVNVAAPVWLSGFVVDAGAPVTRIVNVSSGAAANPYSGLSTYCSSKAALSMAGRVLASELEQVDSLRGRDVAIVSYSPSILDTDMQRVIRESDEEILTRKSKFVECHRNGDLVAPVHPAREIAEWCGSGEDQPFYAERWYTP